MTIAKTSKRIDSIAVKRMPDYDADTSDLGEYGDEPKQYAIVAQGEHEGEFVNSLPCECGHPESQHNDDMIKSVDVGCTADDCACDYFEQVTIERGREYRYFNPNAENYTGEPDADIRKYCLQDYERMRDLNRGEWCYIGIRAVADVNLTGGTIQRIHSGGLWGIESDSDPSDIRSIEREQLDELRDQLHAIGFSKRAIAAAMRNVEREDV